MNVSLNWIKKYVELPKNVDPKELGSKLTLATVEVEGLENQAEALEKIVVGKVVELKAHSGADKLRIAMVDNGIETVQVVCGGSNLKEGMLVAFAQLGAKVRWHGEGDLVTMEKAKIRGEESLGMICASSELGLESMFPSTDDHGIMDLTDKKFKVGQPLSKALGLDDVIYDIDNKSLTNRPDLWGHYGMAREIAAIYDIKLEKYTTDKVKGSREVDLQVEIKDTELCPRYLGVVVDNVKVGSSPAWLVKSLQAVGMRSINNVVDITNYILMDLGQPLHAFDANLVEDNKIVVRRASKGEKFVALDDEEYELNNENLVIADEKKAIALAGVMGGKNSEVNDGTTRIIIESANFNAHNVRKTSEQVGLRTEASMRFEKSLDPEMAEVALKKAVELVLEVCSKAEVVSEVVDEYNVKFPEIEIKTSYDFIRSRIGADIKDSVMKKTLENLGFEVKGDLKVVVPTWRATKDVSIPEDLVEEVARMYGYDNLEPVMPAVKVSLPEKNALRDLERSVKNILVNAGRATEVYNYSFVGEDQLNTLGLNTKKHISLENPINADQSLLRRHLFLGLFHNVVDNLRYENSLNMFEVGKVFLAEDEGEKVMKDSERRLPQQPLMVSGVVTKKGEDEPFYLAKNIVRLLLQSLNVDSNELADTDVPEWLHPKRFMTIEVNGEKIINIGEVHPQILNEMDVDQKVAYWEINLSALNELMNSKVEYKVLNKFPGIELDVATVVEEKITWKQIEKVVIGSAPELIKKVSLFDVYKSGKIGVGKKSLAFHVLYQAEDKTLEMNAVSKLHEKVISNLEKSVGAKVRS